MRGVPGWAGRAVLVVAFIAYQCWAHASLSGASVGVLQAASGLLHAACYLFLLWIFSRTLMPGREPLITRVARRIHGSVQPPMERFTRRVTVAWCVFFAAQLIVSALLFALAPVHAWSMFINLLNLPLLALMFVGQFVFRAIRHPDYPQASPWQVVQAFTEDASRSNRAEVR
jgi:uncharacterized membrane protein